MKFDLMWGRMEIEVWYILIVFIIYILGYEILFLKNLYIEKNMILKVVMII